MSDTGLVPQTRPEACAATIPPTREEAHTSSSARESVTTRRPTTMPEVPLRGRTLDLLVSTALLVGLAPIAAIAALWSFARHGSALVRTRRIGRDRRPFTRHELRSPARLAWYGSLVDVLRGEMSLVGPRALTELEAEELPVEALPRFALRPGVVSPYSLRQRSRIDHEAEWQVDIGLPGRDGVRYRVGVLARHLLASLVSNGSDRPTPEILELFGLRITNTTMDGAVDRILAAARAPGRTRVAFVNPDCLNLAHTNQEYRSALETAPLVLPDGSGLNLACKLLRVNLRGNINGTDLFPRLCEALAHESLPVFLLGAKPGVAEATAENMTARFPGLRIAGSRHGYFSADEVEEVCESIRASGARVVLVAFGAPRQELWIQTHADRLPPGAHLGVGGLFDYYSGRIPRAPIWMRELGLEWIWRLMQEPGRLWRRYLVGNPLFVYRVLRARRRGEHAAAKESRDGTDCDT